jgi:predicted ATPase
MAGRSAGKELINLAEAITSIEFKDYKALGNFSVVLGTRNVLVGPNNCGKSTIIGALRVLAEGIRTARSKSPERVFVGESVTHGYRIPKESIAISTENVHTNYRDIDSSVTFRLSNGNQLRLVFPEKGGCMLIPEAARTPIRSPKSFKSAFPITITVVPVLGPLEHDEPLVEAATVQRNLHTTRASRHFRNYWRYHPDEFQRFSELVEQTWPNMKVTKPVDNGDAIHMFCSEERIDRELYWSGFGFQVWCQLLTHLDRGREATMIVVDEPEIYLHPDLQRQLLEVMFSLGPAIVMATHSAEMIGAADPRDILLIDKKARSAKRLANENTVQQVLDLIGSVHNVTLARIAKHRKVLFVEGKDYSVILRFARIAGHMELAAGSDPPAVQSDGFSNWTKVRDTVWGIRKILAGQFRVASMLDRDYRSDEEVNAIRRELESKTDLAIILRRKEIENYLLVPHVLSKAINAEAQRKRKEPGTKNCSEQEISKRLMEITDPIANEVRAQYAANRAGYLSNCGDKRASATLIKEADDWFGKEWETLDGRIRICPGKQILSKLREWAQKEFGATLTTSSITSKMSKADLAPDLLEALDMLNDFRLTAQVVAEEPSE